MMAPEREAENGRDPRRSRVKSPRLRAAGVLLSVLPVLALAAPGPRPRDPMEIATMLASGAHAGDCSTCHSQHGEGQSMAYEHALIGPDDNTLCDRCHITPWSGGSYAGTWTYTGSAHGSSRTAIWPGPDPPARTEPDAPGKCLNCHDPHGWKDAGGEIPRLMVAREEALCLACHDGSPATTNVRSDLQKAYRHPTTDYSGRHSGPAESLSSDFAVSPVNRRHAECEDCHNPHVARHDAGAGPMPPDASKRLLGVSRVKVLNGAAGGAPSYTFTAGADTLSAPVTEYQLCFKCHSSWTVQPGGQTDLARVLNPANPSYHPVEALGKNLNISALAFVTGWSATSYTKCGDCHGSDLGAAGPHGSSYRYILKAPYTASSAYRTMASNEVCFSCHSYDVYANRDSPESVRAASRFNRPRADKGHAEHVSDKRVPCYACHTTHGSSTLNHLIVTGRSPGIRSYTETSTGGTCSPTCHGSESYTVNYAR